MSVAPKIFKETMSATPPKIIHRPCYPKIQVKLYTHKLTLGFFLMVIFDEPCF